MDISRGNSNASVGELVKYTLTVDRVILGTAADDTIVGDDAVGFIDAKGGNDTVVGSDGDEEILGGVGDDTISGAGGNDVIVDSQGNNILSGDAGDDLINISGVGEMVAGEPARNPTAQIDGGDGRDTLKVAGQVDWSNITVENVEVLDGSGGVSLLTAQEILDKGFVEANNIVFRLAASESDGQLDGSVISGAISLRGTNQSDTLIGNDQSNVIFLLSDTLGVDQAWVLILSLLVMAVTTLLD